ncbi:hypothetical protein ACH4UM_39830 [Streptomyces sp. NPDC020801]|uniref:hypothetical protein n=1 Tax=unclassified Streptomyces TaxID=2593676 RepID=UPI0037B67AFD
MVRERFTPDFDPDCGDAALTSVRSDLVIGRWQGLRDLLRATGAEWPSRGHRIRLLAEACASSSIVESWLAAEPRSADAVVLRAATETARAFNLAIAVGRGVPIDSKRIEASVVACLRAANAYPEDPTPWISLISVARLHPGGVRRQELERWWDMLYERDPYNVEGHLQVLHYYSARWHGSNGLMYDFARDVASVAPPGSALPVLMQYSRVEEYRAILHETRGETNAVLRTIQHWNNDGAVNDVWRTLQCWFGTRREAYVAPWEARDLNYLTHAAWCAGLTDVAASLFRLLGRRATSTPWCYTGDPDKQFLRGRRNACRQG